MALVTIVTRDVADRFRGFLASVMLEVAPCTYVSPRMSKGVRERVWRVMTEWHTAEPRGSIVMIWRVSRIALMEPGMCGVMEPVFGG